MSAAVDALAVWLADIHLLNAALLVVVLAALALLRQPAQRMAIEKAALGGLIALAALCALPGWSLVHLLSEETPAPPTVAASSTTTSAAEPFTPPAVVYDPKLEALFAPVVPTAAVAASAMTPPPTTTAANPRPDVPWTTRLVAAQLVGSAAVIAWLALGAVVARRVRQDTRPAPPELTRKLQTIAETRAPRQPELLVSDRVGTPLALGLRKPAIVLPARFVDPAVAGEDAARDLAAILAHEWAHVAAGDLRTLAVSRLLLVLLWPQPLFWLLRRRLRLDQETLADAAAAEVAGRFDYAQQLLAWSRDLGPRGRAPRLAGAVGLWEGPSQLKRRITALLDDKITVLRECTRRWRWAASVLSLVLASSLSLVTLQRQTASAEASTDEQQSPAAAPAAATSVEDAPLRSHPLDVAGRALDVDGQPIAGATIYLASLRGDWKRLAETTTDAAGAYEFRDVPLPIEPAAPHTPEAGGFEVFGLADGLGFAWRPRKWLYPDVEHYDDANFIGEGDRPHAFGRGDAIKLDLQFTHPQRLAGRLVDDAGQPIAGATLAIRYMNRVPDGGYQSDDEFQIMSPSDECEAFNERAIVPPEFKTRTTDADGRFEFTQLPENVRFWMDIRAEGFPGRTEWGTTRDGIIRYDGDRNVHFGEMNLVLRRPKPVPIRVVYDDTGEPAAKVFVNVANEEARTWKSSDADGRVEVPLPTGDYDVTLSPRYRTPYLLTEAKLTVADAAPAEPHTVRLRRAATIKATVLDAETKQPLAGVDLWKMRIVPRRADGRAYRETHANRSWEEETSISHYEKPLTNADGQLTAFFDPGLYVIGVGNESTPSGYVSMEPEGQQVTCEAGKTVELVFHLRKKAFGNRTGAWHLVPAGGMSALEATRSAPPFVGPGLLTRLEESLTAPAPSLALINATDGPLGFSATSSNNYTLGGRNSTDDFWRVGRNTAAIVGAPADAVLTSGTDPAGDGAIPYPPNTLLAAAQATPNDAGAPMTGLHYTQRADDAPTAGPPQDTTHSTTGIAQVVQADADASGSPETTHTSPARGVLRAVDATEGPTAPAEGQAAPTVNAMNIRCLDPDGAPRPGVTVAVYRYNFRNNTRELIGESQTDDAGQVQFTSLVAAERIAQMKEQMAERDFANAWGNVLQVVARGPGLATTIFGAQEYEVGTRGYRTDVTIPRGERLAGRVTASDGSPVANALVVAGGQAGSPPLEGVNAVRTDAGGRFEFTDRPPFDASTARSAMNSYFLSATAANGVAAPELNAPRVGEDREASKIVVTHPDFAVTTVLGGDIPGTVDVTMLPAAALRGRVVMSDGSAAPAGLRVTAWLDTSLALNEGGVGPAAGDWSTATSHQATTPTQADGRYEFHNLPPGVYDLWVSPPKAPAGQKQLVTSGEGELAVPAGAEIVAAPDLVIGPGVHIRGQLIDGTTGRPLQLATGGEATIIGYPLAAPRVQESTPTVTVTTDGKFEVDAAPRPFRLYTIVYTNEAPRTTSQPSYQIADSEHSTGRIYEGEHGDTIDATVTVWPAAMIEKRRNELAVAHMLANPGATPDSARQAAAAFTTVIEQYPDDVDALLGRAGAYRTAGEFAAAAADLERVLALRPGNENALLHLSDLLATCSDDAVRSGVRAVELATQFLESMRAHGERGMFARCQSLLAAAHAEAGDFSAAIAAQEEAIRLSPRASGAAAWNPGPPEPGDELQRRLKLYRNNQPLRK